ncbi:putative tail component, partial [Escherichia coli PA38]
KSSM